METERPKKKRKRDTKKIEKRQDKVDDALELVLAAEESIAELKPELSIELIPRETLVPTLFELNLSEIENFCATSTAMRMLCTPTVFKYVVLGDFLDVLSFNDLQLLKKYVDESDIFGIKKIYHDTLRRRYKEKFYLLPDLYMTRTLLLVDDTTKTGEEQMLFPFEFESHARLEGSEDLRRFDRWVTSGKAFDNKQPGNAKTENSIEIDTNRLVLKQKPPILNLIGIKNTRAVRIPYYTGPDTPAAAKILLLAQSYDSDEIFKEIDVSLEFDFSFYGYSGIEWERIRMALPNQGSRTRYEINDAIKAGFIPIKSRRHKTVYGRLSPGERSALFFDLTYVIFAFADRNYPDAIADRQPMGAPYMWIEKITILDERMFNRERHFTWPKKRLHLWDPEIYPDPEAEEEEEEEEMVLEGIKDLTLDRGSRVTSVYEELGKSIDPTGMMGMKTISNSRGVELSYICNAETKKPSCGHRYKRSVLLKWLADEKELDDHVLCPKCKTT